MASPNTPEADAPTPWGEGDNIPWDDPDFSRRMLAEHLSQAHAGASRRTEFIQDQVAWIDTTLLEPGARVLDLGCGPGLYCHALALRGHACVGIDFSPASIEYARTHAPSSESCAFHQRDLRGDDYGRDFDLVMLLYGELNVFRPRDAREILARAHHALRPGGQLLLEPSTEAAVREFGVQGRTTKEKPRGLFSDRPHRYITESFWDESTRTATRRYLIEDAETGAMQRHAQTLQAWTQDALFDLATEAGFTDPQSVAGPRDGDVLDLWTVVARRARGVGWGSDPEAAILRR